MTYVYCIARSARKPGTARIPPGLPGADRPVVRTLSDGLWLVTASVPPDQYGPGVLEASLRDIEWVGSIALAHEGVVEDLARRRGVSVIPMKLFTLFSTPDRATVEMRRRRRDLARVFARIEGCEEWGVRVTRGGQRGPARPTAPPQTGAAFLAARKQVRDEAARTARDAAEAAETGFAELAGIARDGRRRTGAAPAPLLDAAFLVPSRRRTRFHAAAERLAKDLAESGGRLTLSGPWPAYNFVDVEEGA